MIKIGNGVDVHAFTEGDHVILGGVRIAHEAALLGHSDADVLIHALCDACLGAAGWGDIGRWFPDSDPRYRNIDSRRLLRQIQVKLRQANWQVINCDATVVAQAPKLAPYIETMEINIAQDLEIEPGRVNVKATTTESLGFTGRGEGIAAFASVLLQGPESD